MKIAYVIASYGCCGGRLTAIAHPPLPATYISLHMDKLRECDSSKLYQIFILKAKASNIDTGFYEYSGEGLPPIKEIDYPNLAQSYGQWARFLGEYPDFDYYILIEDDYCLDNVNAISLLIEEYEKKLPNGGFLCSRILHNPTHAAISNGVVSGKTAVEVFGSVEKAINFILTNPLKEFSNQPVYQINFAVLFGKKKTCSTG